MDRTEVLEILVKHDLRSRHFTSDQTMERVATLLARLAALEAKNAQLGARVLEEEERCIRLSRHAQALEAENARLRHAADGFASAVEAAEAEFTRQPGGMSVPFHGDFASARQHPGIRSRLKWWAREFRDAIAMRETK